MSGKTLKRSLCAFVLTLAFQTLSLGILSRSEARDLTDVLGRGYPPILGGSSDPTASLEAVAPAFSEAVAQAVTQEVPLASVAPAFSYRYNPTLSIFERSSSVPGPLFSERALTLGKGQWNLQAWGDVGCRSPLSGPAPYSDRFECAHYCVSPALWHH